MVTVPVYGDSRIVDGYLTGTARTSKTLYWVNLMVSSVRAQTHVQYSYSQI